MEWIYILLMALASSLMVIIYLVTKLYKVSEQLSIIEDSLVDIKKGIGIVVFW